MSREIDRRSWIAGVAALWLGGTSRADGPVPEEPESEGGPALEPEVAREVEEVRAEAERAGVAPFGEPTLNRYYAVIGNAPEAFLVLTRRDCGAVARDFLNHYGATLGFDVHPPRRRLLVVALEDAPAFNKYLKAQLAPVVGGVYNRKTNRLVVYDYRAYKPELAPLRAGHANLLALAHEATHQLTFNTGLLRREGDAPAAIVEGLAMYGEVRRLDGRSVPGVINKVRLDDLAHIQRRTPWIPVARLLADDRYIQGKHGGDAMLLAYAESWLLVYYLLRLMQAPTPDARFRAYLDAIRMRDAQADRLEVASTHLGDLHRLDATLRRFAVALRKRG